MAKVETYLDRTGQYDLIRTDGPTGYYGSRLDQGIRLFQTANALKVDGIVKPEGPTIQRLGALLLQPKTTTVQASAADADATESPYLSPALDRIESIYRRRVEGMRRRGMPTAADNLEHFLAGSGEPRRLPRAEIIKLKPLREAEAENRERFAHATFRGRTEHNAEVRKLPAFRMANFMSSRITGKVTLVSVTSSGMRPLATRILRLPWVERH